MSCRLFHYYSGRNAWYWTWVQKYPGSNAFSLSLEEAKQKIETQRVQGSTWWIEELPACLFSGKKYGIFITEINTQTPLYDFKHRDLRGETIQKIAEAFQPLKPDSIVRLICYENNNVNKLKTPLGIFKSFSNGGSYRLGWKHAGRSYYSSRYIKLITQEYKKGK